MEVGGLRCGCPLSVALPPRSCARVSHGSAPFASPSSSSPRGSAPFWRPWAPGPAAARSPRGLAEASGKLAQYAHPVRWKYRIQRIYFYLNVEISLVISHVRGML
ncbi:protein ripply2 isoform X2 [Gallus gallus]|uniref:protein ripply2 isoform X2 n=1 Tax=Gallus gallus TaxID=9031 RepID=UPI000D63FFDF|nr:protein ripply2 isoform X2 [Gallus gallus]XP_040523345.1 protein ripply2 isoform X2 [Gallus gallus]|eukprot:XP_025005096.1 protein ripply2 isoform X2 [Gallus gallus]